MTKRLEGKRALVTGGSRGIGAAIARRLAEDGAAVAIAYGRSEDAANALVAEIEAGGGRALALQADVTDPAANERLVDEAAAALGGLDIVVLNAGVANMKPIDEATVADYHAIFDVNVEGVFAGAAAAARKLSDGGSLLITGSVSAYTVPWVGYATYSASKAAVRIFGRGWARDLAPRGIRVNIIQPGPIDTEMNPADGEIAKGLLPQIPLGRYGTGSEVAALASFLASDEASYITGAAIDIDGGLSV